MTIGIVASGSNAGLAVYEALTAVERVATGSIGGFAAYAAIDAVGGLHEYGVQRGGGATLFTDGEITGVMPPKPVAAAPLAAVISSGPDRPEPISQFLSAGSDAGLVSGHRLPNAMAESGQAFNEEVLAGLRAGRSVEEAVDAVLDANPEGDVGLIAVDRAGNIYARNSDRVARRADLGHARRSDGDAVVQVLHNAIGPGPAVAALAAETALDVMLRPWEPEGWFILEAGSLVEAGERAAVELDETGAVERVVTTDASLLTARRNGAAIYLGAEVRQGGRVLGHTITEPNVNLEDGRIVSMSGQRRLNIGYRKP